MLTYSKLVKKPKTFRTFTGFEVEEFDNLYAKVESKYPEYEVKRLHRKDRKRAIGAGRNFNLELIDRLLMLLIYYRLYVTHCLSGFLFDLDQSNTWRNVKYLEPVVKACIPLPEKIHKKVRRIGDMDELLKYFPEMKAFIDATEQEIPRPKNKRRRKNYYSGKKKKHTVKTQIMVNKKGVILHKTRHVPGRRHDYDLFKEKPPPVPPEVEAGMDMGYKGVEKDFPSLKTKLPVKKKKGKKLSRAERRYNKKFSRERVIVEHSIARVKKFGIIGDEFRNRLQGYDDVFSIVSGLVIWEFPAGILINEKPKVSHYFRLMHQEGFDLTAFIS